VVAAYETTYASIFAVTTDVADASRRCVRRSWCCAAAKKDHRQEKDGFHEAPSVQPGDLLKAISMDGTLTLRARVKDVEGKLATVLQPRENYEQCKASAHALTDTGRRGAACGNPTRIPGRPTTNSDTCRLPTEGDGDTLGTGGEIQRRTAGDRP